MKRTIMLVIGWLAACFILFAALMQIDFILNLFSWRPYKWDWRIPISGVGVLASITAIWFLAKATRDRVSRVVSLLVCLVLVWIAIHFLPAEPIDHSGYLGRSEPSPLWFRGSMAVLMALPGVIWLVCLKRNRRPLL
jgi:hypothetical protein